MATYREIVYFALDELKERSDDAYYTEEHMLFIASKARALLLERKYNKSRNKSFTAMSDENMQQICVPLEVTELLPYDCGGSWLRSVNKIPDLMNIAEPVVNTVGDMLRANVTMIPIERMPYVGYNKWLQNIIYAAKSVDGYLYLSSPNPQFLYLKNVKLKGVFKDPVEAAQMACDGSGVALACEPLDMEFPLEESMVLACVEMMVQLIAGPRYAPEDKQNDARDNLSDIALVGNRNSRRTPRRRDDDNRYEDEEQ